MSALTATSQILLRDTVWRFCAGKWDIDVDALKAYVAACFPRVSILATRTDVSLALRAAGFVRDRAAGAGAWKHRHRDHPRWGRRA